MKNLPKEKKQNVILVGLVTLMVAAGWWFGVLAWQRDHLRKAERQLQEKEGQFVNMTNTLARSANLETELVHAEDALAALEAQMATGDIFSWAVNTLREFRQNYKVEMPQVAQPVIGPTTLLPRFPYQQAALTVSGTAHFHDLGLFIADFENRFPFARINNLELKPASSMGGDLGGPERLAFTMDIIFLIKPNA
ncbi:MAG: hypothetical protein ACK45B_01405 [Limisphaerales bacterium]